jgi:hypothetical protein
MSRTTGTILRSTLDGANAQVVLDGTSRFETVAVDSNHERLYYGTGASDPFQVFSANLDGSDVRVALNARASDLAVDPAAGFLFTNGISRVGLGGQNPTTIRPSGANGIALDPIAQKIYWTDGSVHPRGPGDPDSVPGHVYRANYDGSGVETIIDGGTFASEIAVDPIRGMIYWYNPIVLHIVSATTNGVRVNDNLLDREISSVEGLAIDYIIPEPSTAILTLAAATLASLAALLRRRTRPTRRPFTP